MPGRLETRAGRVAAIAALALLAAPSAAAAHLRTGVVALDYRAGVGQLTPPLRAAVAVRVYPSDLALGLTARRGHTVAVPGYLGEPFLRLGPAGAEVSTRSPTAATAGLLRKGSGSGWRLISNRPTVVWHDVRVRELAPWLARRSWALPLTVDGRHARLAGEVWRVNRPAPWPWLAFAVPFAACAILLLVRRPSSPVRAASVAFGALAGVAMLVTMAAFAFDPNASAGTWLEAGNETAFALVGFAFLARGGRDSRAIAGGALGLLGLAAGLSKLPVLLHGVVLSQLPAWAARSGVVLMIAAGATATVLGLVVFFESLDWEGLPQGRTGP